MAFEPPPNPSAGLTFQYGNIVWQFDGTAGVWNIQDASIVGGAGPEGPIGPTGNTGDPSTGDSAAIIVSNGYITARLADTSVTGVASFNSSHFNVVDGEVSLLGGGGVGAAGVTGIGFGNDVGLTGKINFTAGANVTITETNKTITISAKNGITANKDQVLFSSVNGATGSNRFLFDGVFATFGAAEETSFTFTGPAKIKGGWFVNPAEYALWDSNSILGNTNLLVRADRGSVQRYTVNHSGANGGFKVDIDTNEDGWTKETGVAETVIVAIQSLNGKTGSFGSNIITSSPPPTLLGVTGGVDVLSIMRIQTLNGSAKMGFVIARGLTGAGLKIFDP